MGGFRLFSPTKVGRLKKKWANSRGDRGEHRKGGKHKKTGSGLKVQKDSL